MKLVIDIPEQMYLNSKKDMLCGADILVSAIKNGTPYETVTEFADRCRECGREKVLDKIRAEIEQEPYVSKMEVLEIIDEYRTESKKV
jgi:hypothetical protein